VKELTSEPILAGLSASGRGGMDGDITGKDETVVELVRDEVPLERGLGRSDAKQIVATRWDAQGSNETVMRRTARGIERPPISDQIPTKCVAPAMFGTA
jgi:hypothetical protein